MKQETKALLGVIIFWICLGLLIFGIKVNEMLTVKIILFLLMIFLSVVFSRMLYDMIMKGNKN